MGLESIIYDGKFINHRVVFFCLFVSQGNLFILLKTISHTKILHFFLNYKQHLMSPKSSLLLSDLQYGGSLSLRQYDP